MRGVENEEKIDVTIPIDQFQHEARDFSEHNVTDFFKTSFFTRDFVIEGRQIKTTTKI